MRRRAVAMVVVLGGCFTKPPPPGGVDPTGDGGATGDGRVIGSCWAPARIDHDEDGDDAMDGCDNCPADDNPQQDNDDGDDVGDVCDPRPGMMDRIVFFDAFAVAPSPAAWSKLDISGSPNWDIVDDTMQVTNAATGVLQLGQLFRNAIVDVRYDSGATTHLNGVWIRTEMLDAAGADHVECYTGNNGLSVRHSTDNSTGFAVFSNAGSIRLVATDAGICSAFRVSPATVSLPALLPSAEGYIGLHTQASPARFTSITVFGP